MSIPSLRTRLTAVATCSSAANLAQCRSAMQIGAAHMALPILKIVHRTEPGAAAAVPKLAFCSCILTFSTSAGRVTMFAVLLGSQPWCQIKPTCLAYRTCSHPLLAN